MTKYISAKEFRKRFPNVADELKRGDEIIVLKRSKPLFKVIPFEEGTTDLLLKYLSDTPGQCIPRNLLKKGKEYAAARKRREDRYKNQ